MLVILLSSFCSEKINRPRNGLVIFSPAIVEMLFYLDRNWAETNIAAVGVYSNYPEAARQIQKEYPVGSLMGVNLERISMLSPREIILQGKNLKVFEFCQQFEIRCHNYRIQTIDDTVRFMKKFRDLIGSAAANKSFQSWQAALQRRLQSKPPIKKTVLLAAHRLNRAGAQFVVAGRGTFLYQLAALNGAEPVVQEKGWPRLSLERLLRFNPDLVWETAPPGTEKDDAEYIVSWGRWFKQSQVKIWHHDVLLRPGPRIIEAFDLLANEMKNHERK